MSSKKPHKKTEAPAQSHSQPSHLEASDAEVKVVDVEDGIQGGSAEHATQSQAQSNFDNNDDGPSEAEQKEKIELNFAGSEMLRAKFPKPFEILETVATDWVNDGKFEGLPVGHPLAQYFAAKGLRKAKEVEKKVLESPVTEKIAMQAFTVGMKATAIVQEVRSKIKNK